ncbi:hypothetical protein FRC03_004050 [Tulasnella sp. 419]|nr:hypothetical protein FRC03_004050 [Tulasnella sp. 419]
MPSPVLLATLFHAIAQKSRREQTPPSQRQFDNMADEELGRTSSSSRFTPQRVRSPSPTSPGPASRDDRHNEELVDGNEEEEGEGEGAEENVEEGERIDQAERDRRPPMRHQSSSSTYTADSAAISEDQSGQSRHRRRLPRWRPFNTQPPPPDQRGWIRRIRYFIWQNDPDADSGEFIPNYRYLPILSGILSPFAILLEIPALTEPWYIRTEGNKTVETRSNPMVLEAGMAVSMAFAVIANTALIMRFLEKRVKVMTIICMLFLILHDVINIIAVTVFGVVHRHDDGFTYGEAFWITVCSTIASIVATATLGWDLWHTPDFAKSGSGLTRKQRSLIILVMILITYIALGSLVYAVIMDLTFQDGLYFTVVSIETIGFGDIAPNNTGSRVFAIFYNTFGIINVGLVVSTTRDTIVEAFENAYRKRRAEVARRRHETRVLKANKKARRVAVENVLKEAGLPVYVRNENAPAHLFGVPGTSAMKLNEDALNDEQREQVRQTVEKVHSNLVGQQSAKHEELPHAELDPTEKKGRAVELSQELQKEVALSGVPGKDETQEESFQDFRKRILEEEQKEFATKLIVAWSFFLTFWVVGAAIFMHTEKPWSYGDSLYFCWVSFVTIGYGDLTPKSPAGRAIFVVWALMGVAAMTILISVLSEAYSTRYNSALQTGSFEKAIKSFNRKANSAAKSKEEQDKGHPKGAKAMEAVTLKKLSEEKWPPKERTQQLLEKARDQLDEVPLDVIKHAKAFNDHVRYFADHPQHPDEPPPPGLSALLDELAQAEQMDPRMKDELLADEEARRTLFFMSYERAFKRLLETAERTVNLLAVKDAERDALIARLEEATGMKTRMAPALNNEDTSTDTSPTARGSSPPASGPSGPASAAIRFALDDNASASKTE